MTQVRGAVEGTREGSYLGQRIELVFGRRTTVGDVVLTTTDRAGAVLPADGSFAFEIPELTEIADPVELRLLAPSGELLAARAVEIRALAKPLTLRADPVETLDIPVSTDPTLGQNVRLVGRVVDSQGRVVPAGLPVVLWGVARPVEGAEPPPQALLVADTASRGAFAGPWPAAQLGRAFGTVQGEASGAIPLDADGRLPKKVLLLITLGDAGAKEGEGCELRNAHAAGARARRPGRASGELLAGPRRRLRRSHHAEPGAGRVQLLQRRAHHRAGDRRAHHPAQAGDSGGGRRSDSALAEERRGGSSDHRRRGREGAQGERHPQPRKPAARGHLGRDRQRRGPDPPGRAAAARPHRARRGPADRLGRHADDLPGDRPSPTATCSSTGRCGGPTATASATCSTRCRWRRGRSARSRWWTGSGARPRRAPRRSTSRSSSTRSSSRDRDISEIVGSRLSTRRRAAARAPAPGASPAASARGSSAAASASSAASRAAPAAPAPTPGRTTPATFGANSLQQLRDRMMQRASAVRDERSTVIQTVGQGETVRAETEVVANYNHCHAMTVEYFEVLRHFLVSHELADVRECLFVPLPIGVFDRGKALRWREALRRYLRQRNLRRGFHAIDRIARNWVGWDFPEHRYSEESPRPSKASCASASSCPGRGMPRTASTRWRRGSRTAGCSPSIRWSSARRSSRPAPRGPRPRTSARGRAAHRRAARAAPALRVRHPHRRPGPGVPLDATLVSRYAEATPLYVSLRPAGPLPALPREEIAAVPHLVRRRVARRRERR